MAHRKLIGPFAQLLTMDNLPLRGPLADAGLEIIRNAGIVTEGENIVETGDFESLTQTSSKGNYEVERMPENLVALPGFIDAHTHICWAGSRAEDYSKRLQGKTYSEIAASGGGIWDTVIKTRKASLEELTDQLVTRAARHLSDGVTTIEVKSGYGLTVKDEIKMLRAIKRVNQHAVADLIPTCLAAHIRPKDYSGTNSEYLKMIRDELLPRVAEENLSRRVDIYTDEHAFSIKESEGYLNEAKSMGFDITVHADQFTGGGTRMAVRVGAVSADHLEVSGEKDIKTLAGSNVIPVTLPGSSLGLGAPFAPARKLLDGGCSLVIASDWNPGSAPMGDLLIQACILGMYEKLTLAETLAALTFRAAAALNLKEWGIIKPGYKADIIAFNLADYKEIIYNQGKVKPVKIWKNASLTE